MNQIDVLGISRGIYYNLLECDDPTGFADFSEGFSGIHKEIVSGIKLELGGADVGSSNPLPVGGKSVQKSASFTRPADTTAYAANDAIADSTSAPTLLSFALYKYNGGQGYIVKTRLLTNQKRVRHVLDYRFITQHQALLMITHLSPCFTQIKIN